MQKIKDIVNSSWFKAAAIGGIGVLLLLDKNIFYSDDQIGWFFQELKKLQEALNEFTLK